MAKNKTVAVTFKKRTLRVPLTVKDTQTEPDVAHAACATCGKNTLKLIEVVRQSGMWFDEYLWLCYCPKCEAATALRVYEDKENE